MVHRLSFNILILMLAMGSCHSQMEPEMAGENWKDDGIFRALFLGNSHTYYNDLPDLIKELAWSHGDIDSMFMHVVAPGGYSLADHLALQEKQKDIESERWDAVIIQENASIASLTPEEAEQAMIQPAYQLGRKIKANNPDTRIIWYMTHAYRNGIIPCESDEEICSFNSMLTRIRSNYLTAGSVVISEWAPAGIIWKLLFSKSGDIVLHDDDDIHPNLLGSWVSAATIYAILFGHRLETDKLNLPEEWEHHRSLIVREINASVFESDPDWKVF